MTPWQFQGRTFHIASEIAVLSDTQLAKHSRYLRFTDHVIFLGASNRYTHSFGAVEIAMLTYIVPQNWTASSLGAHCSSMAEENPTEKKSISFLDLPAEIRNEIYSVALKGKRWAIPIRRDNSGTLAPAVQEPALLAVSRQIRNESIDIFYGSNDFRTYDIYKFLDQLSSEKIARLRALHAFDSLFKEATLERDGEVERVSSTWLKDDVCYHANEIGARYGPVGLRKDAVLVPMYTTKEVGPFLKSKSLTEIEMFEVVDIKDGGWRVHWKGPQ